MGFDTYLEVDQRVVLMWRKHASATPQPLFQLSDLRIGDDVDDDGETVVDVRFSTTAGGALSNLERAGLGWHAAVSAYAETRVTGYSGGLVMADSYERGTSEPRDGDRRLAAFEALPGDVDLLNLGQVMLSRWRDETQPDVPLLEDLTYDGALPDGGELVFRVWELARQHKVDNPEAAARATESLVRLDRMAPMLSWPLIVCVFLHALPGGTPVELVLTEDAQRTAEVQSRTEAVAYAEEYWAMATDALAQEARTLERLFAVLAGSGAARGTEFWFARAADLLGRLEVLKTTPGISQRAHGDAFESLVDAVLRTEEPDLNIIEKNLRTTEEELDLVLANGLNDPFWSALSSALILVECKNWSRPAGIEPLRVLESKMRDRGALCRIGLFVSMSGFTKPFLVRLKSVQSDIGVIFALSGDDLRQLISEKRRVSSWMRDEGLRRSLGTT